MRNVLERRVAELRRELGNPRQLLFVAVYCNHCERIETALTLDALLAKLDGWLIGADADYCPICRPTDEQWLGSFPKAR